MATDFKHTAYRRKRILFYLFPLAGYAGLIFALSSFSLDIKELEPVFKYDKLLHLAEYYVLGFLLVRAFATSHAPFLARRPVLAACVVGTLYGLSDEFHQYFVPGRSADVMDFLFDAAGVILAAGTFSFLRRRLWPLRAVEDRIEAEVTRR
jgi:VanZ family protein